MVATVLPALFTGESAISMAGVLDEITGLLPVVLPVMISFIAIRKGIGFIQSVLHGA